LKNNLSIRRISGMTIIYMIEYNIGSVEEPRWIALHPHYKSGNYFLSKDRALKTFEEEKSENPKRLVCYKAKENEEGKVVGVSSYGRLIC
jgi:hypothetical protein